MPQLSMDAIVEKSEELPALPRVVHKVLQMINEPDSSVEVISRLISEDPVLTFRLLKLANSAYYGFTRKVSTVGEAVVLLGYTTIHNLILAASVFNAMNKEITGYVLEKGELWRHSMVAALTARLLAQKTSACDAEKAFTAALMHDIGKIVINTYIAPQFREVVAMTESERLPFMKAEEIILGFNHAQIGGRVAAKWNLPDELVEAIECHHEPLLAKCNPQLTAVVHVADVTCMAMGVGLGGDGLMYPIEPRTLDILGINPSDIDGLISEIVDGLHSNKEMLMAGA